MLVVPRTIREELNLREGQRILMRVEAGRIIVEPLPWEPYELMGKLIGEPYDEGKGEARAEEWLKRHPLVDIEVTFPGTSEGGRETCFIYHHRLDG